MLFKSQYTLIFICCIGPILIGQNVGIDVINPTEKLDVNGHINLAGEIKNNGVGGQSGDVLTSLGNGSMIWSPATNNQSTSGNIGHGTWGECLETVSDYYPYALDSGNNGDKFGWRVSIFENIALVSAPFATVDNFTQAGKVYVLSWNNIEKSWEIQSELTNPDPAFGENFGFDLRFKDNYAIISAPFDTETGKSSTGSASIFKYEPSNGTWTHLVKLININAEADDRFGSAVDIDFPFAAIGAKRDDESGKEDCGSVSTFMYNTNTQTWEPQAKLIEPTPNNFQFFGEELSISGNRVAVGVSTFSNPNERVYIYERNITTNIWGLDQTIPNTNVYTPSDFGASISLDGVNLLVGSPGDRINGLNLTGSVSIYSKNSNTNIWEKRQTIINSNLAANQLFGYSVSLQGEYALIGANLESSSGVLEKGTATIIKRYGNSWRKYQKIEDPNGNPQEWFGSNVAFHKSGSLTRFLISSYHANNDKGIVFFGTLKSP